MLPVIPLETTRLSQLSLFAGLAPATLSQLAGACVERHHRPGDVLWEAGDAAEELVVVLTGELEVRSTGPGGVEEVIGRARSGECVGEMALLLDEARSARVVCSRRGRFLSVPKESFRRAVADDPAALLQFAAVVTRRAMALARRQGPSHRAAVVAVVAAPGADDSGVVTAALGSVAGRLLGSGAVVTRVDPAGAPLEEQAERLRTTAGRRLVIAELAPGGPEAVEGAQALFDHVVHITRRGDPAPAGPVPVHRVVLDGCASHGGGGRAVNQGEPYLLAEAALPRGGPGSRSFAAELDNPASALNVVLGRLVRKILGISVGIALGGGAAYGIANIGVLLALEEAGIPVDLVGGTSMGSVIAIAYAAGQTAAGLAEAAGRMGTVRTTLSVLDPTIAGTGLLAGRRLMSVFRPLIPADTFDQLVRPCRVVAMDVETGERVDIGTGRLDDAFRASCSIPLVFSPVRSGERTLVDGGMIDPVPADVVREMGADVVVGVNVVPRLEKGSTTALSRLFARVNRLNRLNPMSYVGPARGGPHVADVLMNSLQVVQHELGNFNLMAADVRVGVDMAGFTWIEFYRAGEIIERGRRAGEAMVPELRALLERRLEPYDLAGDEAVIGQALSC